MCTVVVNSGAVDTACLTVDFGDLRFCEILDGRARNAVCRRGIAVGLVLGLVELGTLCSGLVDVATELQVQLALGYTCSLGLGISIRIGLSFGDDRICCRLPRLKSSRGVTNDLEVTRERRTSRRRAVVRVDLSSSVRCTALRVSLSENVPGN